MNMLSRNRLVDELVEAYVEWREACARVSDAYRFWASETAPGTESRSGCLWRRSTPKSRPPRSTAGS